MYESEYSFAKYAVNKGYSVFLYDRLGTGSSTKYTTTPIKKLISILTHSAESQDMPTRNSQLTLLYSPH